jgi:DNA-binding LytR/AlgR family response regulator
MINCLIIDDEPLALDILRSYIEKVPFLKLEAAYNEPFEALQHLNNNRIDLLFLDIHMPDINGIDFFKSLHKKPEVIFTTAYSEYATEGFNLQAIDYLLKPIPLERFVASVNRAKDYIDFQNNKTNTDKEYFFINASYKIHKIFFKDIIYMEGLKDYTKIYLEAVPNPLLVLQNLKYFEEFLPKDDFIRVHRSYITSIKKLNTITRKLVTIGNVSMPVSDHYRDGLFSLINMPS